MKLSEAIEEYLLSLQDGNHTASTRQIYQDALAALLTAVGDVPLKAMTIHDLRLWGAEINHLVEAGSLSV